MYLSKSILIKCLVVSCIILLSQGKSVKKGTKKRESCKSHNSQNIDDESVECQPRSQVVPIPRLSYEVFEPNAVRVNICSGSCGNMEPCIAKRIQPRHFNVTNKHMGKQLRQVDEHLECECCGLTADICESREKEFNREQCTCECKNQNEEWICSENGTIWDKRNCKCKCPGERQCPNDDIWSDSDCMCIDNPNYSIYEDYNNI